MVKSKGERTVHKAMKTIDKLYDHTPGFSDIFDEELWYQFCFVFTMCTFVVAFLLSRYITIRSTDPLDRERRRKKNKTTKRNDSDDDEDHDD
jgi:hypothetical protein